MVSTFRDNPSSADLINIELPSPEISFMDNVDLKCDLCISKFKDYISCLEATNVSDMEKATRGLSDNLLWRSARHGRITSSVFGKIFSRKQENTVKEIMGYNNVPQTPALKWG